ncbi:hypothetical protein CEB3_c48270 [Peptococcaceae bacterium CEB3]|nr:hypothetical protein CEB3_c48270 [Peptococcaceae bacterium CEB3]
MPSKGTQGTDLFDERQVQVRNRIGHHSYFLLYFLLMLNLLLPGYGVRWAGSQESILAAMLLSLAYYLIRVAWAGAYTPARDNSPIRLYVLVGVVMVVTTLLGIAKQTNFFKKPFSITGGFLQVLLFLLVFLLIIIVSRKISMHRNDKGND